MSVEKPSREVMMKFLQNGVAMMKDPKTSEELKNEAKYPEPGEELINLQRKEWDVFCIDRDVGCQALDNIDPSDQELFSQRQEFVFTAMRTFIKTIEDRKPVMLEKVQKMPKAAIMRFFNACDTKMDLPETHAVLSDYVQQNKKQPNTVIIEMQRDMLEVIGFEREHGCRMLSNVGTDFPKDKELHQRMMVWKNKAHTTSATVLQANGYNVQGAGTMSPAQMMAQQRVNAEIAFTRILNSSAEMKEMSQQAKTDLDAMKPEDREALMMKMSKKIETLMKLPGDKRTEYFEKLLGEDKAEIVKAQVLMLSIMVSKRRMGDKQQKGKAAAGGPAATQMQMTMDGGGSSSSGPANPIGKTDLSTLQIVTESELGGDVATAPPKPSNTAAPGQQQMM